jgi:translocation and assembly module TamB
MDPVAARRLALGGRVTQSEAGLGFDLAGEGAGLVLDEVPAELTREVALVLKGGLAGDMLGLDTLTLESPLVSAGASGTIGFEAGIDASALDLGYTLRTADLAPVAAAYGIDAAGALDASGRAGGTAAAPSLVGKAGIAAAAFAGRDYGAVSLTHDVTLGAAPAGSLALATRGGWLGDGTAATGFRLEGSRLALEKLTAALLGISVAGAAAIDFDTTLADAALDVSAPDLAPLGRLAGTPIAGAATGRLALSSAGGRQDGSAGLTFRNLGSGEARLAAAELTLAAGDLRGRPRIEARLAAGGVSAGGVALDRAIAQA